MKATITNIGLLVTVPNGMDSRSYCCGVLAGMAPHQWDGVKAWHAVASALAAKAVDVQVCRTRESLHPDGVPDSGFASPAERTFTFDEFERWIAGD